MKLWTRALLYVGLICGGATTPTMASPFTQIYAFGDSLSDVGNLFIASGGAIPAAPYFAGRFSNGPNWIDDLSASLGLGPVKPALAGGTDFAFGGAVTGPAVPAPPAAVPNLGQQVGLFTLATGGAAPSSALYTVWIGSNDVFHALDDIVAGMLTVPQAEADLGTAAQAAAGAVNTLAGEGAKTFVVPLVPDLGKTPDATDVPGLPPIATLLSGVYNTALQGAIDGLDDDIDVHFLDTFALIDAAVADPAAFGYTNVTDRCYVGPYTGGGTVCATPDTYLFWDGLHPTAPGYARVAALAAAAVPEPPAMLILLLAGAVTIGLRARARRRP